MWATFEGTHPRLDGLAAWAPTYRHQAWCAALQAAGCTDNLEAQARVLEERYIAGQRAGHPPLPGAVDLVRRQSAAVPVAIVTNGPPDIQRLKIEQCGVAPLLCAVVISGELGVGKPDPSIFGAALGQLGVQAQRAVMVGDNWDRDVGGALAVGMEAVWISHGRERPEPHASSGDASAEAKVAVARGPADVALV